MEKVVKSKQSNRISPLWHPKLDSNQRPTALEVSKMARKRYVIPQYGTVIMAGKEYYRTRIEDADGKRVALYGRTREELYDKVLEAREQIEDNTFRRSSPTVKEYCEKWLLLQSAQVRATTLTDYTSKVNRHIIKPLGHMNIADVTADDIRLALVPVSKKSASVYKSVNILYASVDPKTVQYLAGHENSKVTMDIYAKVKYNKPAQLHGVINRAIDTSKKD